MVLTIISGPAAAGGVWTFIVLREYKLILKSLTCQWASLSNLAHDSLGPWRILGAKGWQEYVAILLQNRLGITFILDA